LVTWKARREGWLGLAVRCNAGAWKRAQLLEAAKLMQEWAEKKATDRVYGMYQQFKEAEKEAQPLVAQALEVFRRVAPVLGDWMQKHFSSVSPAQTELKLSEPDYKNAAQALVSRADILGMLRDYCSSLNFAQVCVSTMCSD
jgi:hypothetical protein